ATRSVPNSPRPAADVMVEGPGGCYNHDLGLLAVVVALFGGIDRKAHRFRLALVRSVFFIIELDYPSVAVGLLPLDEVPNIRHVSLLVRSALFADNAARLRRCC